MRYYDTYGGTMGIYFSVNHICFRTAYDANLDKMYCQVLFYHPLHNTSKPEEKLESTGQSTFFGAFSLVSLSIHPRSRRGSEPIRHVRALEPPPEDGA